MNKLIVALLSFASLLFVAGFAQAADTSAWSEGGLVKKDVPGIDTAYVRPGASLAEYKKVLLKPVQVSFRRGWLKQPLPGSKFPINPADAQDIRDKVAKLMQDEFRKELEAGGYQVTDAPGEDVLQVDAAVADLYVAAPKSTKTPTTKIVAVSAGEMSLVAILSDSMTGDALARVFDYASAHETTRGQSISSVENEAEARGIVKEWAKLLRHSLDAARGMK
jgi:hypothetical protein